MIDTSYISTTDPDALKIIAGELWSILWPYIFGVKCGQFSWTDCTFDYHSLFVHFLFLFFLYMSILIQLKVNVHSLLQINNSQTWEGQPQRGAPTCHLTTFLPKTPWKWKKLDRERTVLSEHPLASDTGSQMFSCQMRLDLDLDSRSTQMQAII